MKNGTVKKQIKFKSNPKVELGLTSLEEIEINTTFVKKRKLIIFIDKETDNLVLFKKTINKFDFHGTVKYYRTTQEAIDFLQKVTKPNQSRATADLIFCQFKMPEIDGLQLIEKLQLFYQAEGAKDPRSADL